MNKLKIIIRREYLTKVKKKSFFVMTILGPILMTLLIVLPIMLKENTEKSAKVIVVDEVEKTIIKGDTISFFQGKFKTNDKVNFSYMKDINQAQALLKKDACDCVLEISSTNDNPPIKTFLYYGNNEPSVDAKEEIESQTKQIFKNSILRVNYDMNEEDIKMINDPKIDSYTKDIRTGEDSYSEVKMALGTILAFVIYFFIFMFGSQVMRSVGEEKTSRIVEVLVSSVKSIQLLLGKIIAIALVGLTQVGLWILLTLVLVSGVKMANPTIFSTPQQETIQVKERVISADKMTNLDNGSIKTSEVLQAIHAINFPLVIGMFVVFFLLGYLLYGSLFGAAGSLIDADTDTGQFTLPITIPLIFAMICIPMVMNDPNSTLAIWLSIIPYTSPLIMLIRVPYGLPFWQLWVSIGALIVTIAINIYISAKIYRTGILMYGKNITYKELWKWLKAKN
jgi:ABC-2 type transport system permease protein